MTKMPLSKVRKELAGLGFDRIKRIYGSTWKDSSTVIIIPERTAYFHHRWVSAFQNMCAPMNQKRAVLFAIGDEVGHAYTNVIKRVLEDPQLSTWRYVLTIESDNLVPPDAHLRLLESIEAGPFDAVGGLYFTKGEINQPMCFGKPGTSGFEPLDIREAIQDGSSVVECNGIAMGCSLYRMSLFREVEPPWFVTTESMTQDLYFCKQAKAQGKRFACDTRVHVGHMDLNDGTVY